MRFVAIGALSAMVAPVLAAAPAWAQAKEPVYVATPSWVRPVTLDPSAKKNADAPARLLFLSAQNRLTDDSDETYVETAILVQKPEGLAVAGALAFPWQPDQTELRIHKVEIHRAGKVVDVLGAGQRFEVLRRETNLERAMLDGTLTAAMQPEGIQVGDTLRVGISLARRQGSVPFRPESFIALPPGMELERADYRFVYPDSPAFRVKADGRFAAAKENKGPGQRELVLSVSDLQMPKAVEDAPPRYLFQDAVQVSGYRDWSDVAALLAPVYRDAAALSPDSPIRAEAAKIRAAHATPAARALAALRVVQDDLRYVFLGMDEGGYIPTPADKTWARRFGDCKGKTTVLLALLRALDIAAVPVAVSTKMGDGLDQRLPSTRLFDHVMVRAEIDGRTYWLDGTRMGDRRLEDLRGAPHRWALPLEAGAKLVAVPPALPSLPTVEWVFETDASAGYDKPAPYKGTLTYRGEWAQGHAMTLSELKDEPLKDKLRELVAQHIYELDTADLSYRRDGGTGDLVITIAGAETLDWDAGDGKRRRYQFDHSVAGWWRDLSRDGDAAKLPFLIDALYQRSTETLILPKSGKGFTFTGQPFKRVIGPVETSREQTVADGRATVVNSFRLTKPEFDAAEALETEKGFAALNELVFTAEAPRSAGRPAKKND